MKNRIPIADSSKVVYKIDCMDCDKCYIGQTKNYLQNRINNHKNNVAKHQEKTALATHALTNLHTFDFNNTKIISRESNYKKRLFIEMAHILNNKTVNFQTDTNNLSNIYYNIIKST